MAPAAAPSRPREDARERVLAAAYKLFCRNGVRAVGIDTVIAESGVAKMSVYRHFRSKDDLVLAVLERREQLWTRGFVEAGIRRRASDPAGQLLAVFDVFDGWFRKRDFEGCFFINALLEFEDPAHPIHQACRRHLAVIRGLLQDLAEAAGARDPSKLAQQWHILMKGSIVVAAAGDRTAARRAKELGALLLERELGTTNRQPGN